MKAEPHLTLREVGGICRPAGATEGTIARPLPSPALGLVSGRACQAELSARVKQEVSTRGSTPGTALPTAGKNSVLARNGIGTALGHTDTPPLLYTIPGSRLRAPWLPDCFPMVGGKSPWAQAESSVQGLK